ncbi:LmeA family phospholipid-binding protein [Ruania halotolerans]|uniref:LmeA family phospholipid-binding protein n=1 Tax=Ruania halotolerans TaxID=2897773 RepID=UPI001E44E38C|nr:DUF2993 domain-containing protein [Ruania halotolerans]UFU06246.1 DUF2993 domain-containing protein [Ruania halotolerans]
MSRSGKAALGIVVILVLLLGGGYAFDRWAVAQTEAEIESELDGSFPQAQGTQVQIPGFLFLPHLLTGSLNTVELTADDVRTDGLDLTDVHILAHGVAVSEPRTVAEMTVSATVPAASIESAVAASGRVPEDVTIDITDGALVASATVLGMPLEAALAPVVTDGVLLLEPQTFTLGGIEVDASAVPEGMLGDLGSLEVPLDELPGSLTLSAIEVVGESVQVELTGNDIALTDLG